MFSLLQQHIYLGSNYHCCAKTFCILDSEKYKRKFRFPQKLNILILILYYFSELIQAKPPLKSEP